ncbi:MAG: hypothetical protein WAM71_22375 [Candidatus Korobacteraceae bacterium]
MYKRKLSYEQMESRGKNAVADLLARKLLLPKIFFEARWPSRSSAADVLAIDRAGAGDIYLVEVAAANKVLDDLIERLKIQPAHYKYMALISSAGNYRPREGALYAPNGMGRIGVLLLEEDHESKLSAREILAAERFRVAPEYIKQLDKFIDRQHADREVRV